MGMIKEFKEFAVRGNLVDTAVAFVMGVSFGKIVTSFVDGIIMPLVGMLTGGVDFNDKKWVLQQAVDAVKDAAGTVVTPAVTEVSIKYGEFITNLIEGKKVPVYGDGMQVRDWLYVEDHCRAIDLILHRGKIGETYCIGGASEKPNLAITKEILRLLNKGDEMVEYVKDRPGHDRRYAIDFSKIKASGYAFIPELKYLLSKSGATFFEVPITFIERTQGESKFSFPIFWEGIFAPWKMIFKK